MRFDVNLNRREKIRSGDEETLSFDENLIMISFSLYLFSHYSLTPISSFSFPPHVSNFPSFPLFVSLSPLFVSLSLSSICLSLSLHFSLKFFLFLQCILSLFTQYQCATRSGTCLLTQSHELESLPERDVFKVEIKFVL